MLCRRLQALLLGVEASDYNLVFDRIFHALEEIRTELKVGAAKSVFEKTAFEIQYQRDYKTGEINSIKRVFELADREIYRDDIQTGVGDQGYLDLTPYSFSITRGRHAHCRGYRVSCPAIHKNGKRHYVELMGAIPHCQKGRQSFL